MRELRIPSRPGVFIRGFRLKLSPIVWRRLILPVRARLFELERISSNPDIRNVIPDGPRIPTKVNAPEGERKRESKEDLNDSLVLRTASNMIIAQLGSVRTAKHKTNQSEPFATLLQGLSGRLEPATPA